MLKSSTVLSDHQYAGLWLGQYLPKKKLLFPEPLRPTAKCEHKNKQQSLRTSIYSTKCMVHHSCTVCYNTFLHDGSKLFANGTAHVSQTAELAISLRSRGRGMRCSTKKNNSDTWRSFLRPLWGQKCQTKLPETNLRNLLQN